MYGVRARTIIILHITFLLVAKGTPTTTYLSPETEASLCLIMGLTLYLDHVWMIRKFFLFELCSLISLENDASAREVHWGKQEAGTSNFMDVQSGLHENRVAPLKPGTKASCVVQTVGCYAYAYSIRKVLLTKLCAKSFAAAEGIISYMVDVNGWLGVWWHDNPTADRDCIDSPCLCLLILLFPVPFSWDVVWRKL